MPRPPSDKNLKYLSEHGPTLKEDLPREPTQADKKNGLFTFQISAGRGSADPSGGRPNPVCYLKGHNREEVLVEFLECNPRLIEAKSLSGIIQVIGGQGRRWKEAAKDVAPQYYDVNEEHPSEFPGTPHENETKRCEFCNEHVVKSNFPNHLATKCSGT